MKKISGFTLVELIIVVTILAILLTIGSISYSGYSRDSRDSARITEIRNIQTALNLYEVDNGNYPLPDNASEIELYGNTVWYQGTFGDSVFQQVRRLSQKPLDPLFGTEYSYSLLQNRKEYQISTVFEGRNIAVSPNLNNAYAQNYRAYTSGNYNQRISYVKNNSDDIILALPSITSSDVSSDNLLEIVANNNLVIHGKNNLARDINTQTINQSGQVQTNSINTVVFSGNIRDLRQYANQRQFLVNLKNTYANPEIESSISKDIYNKIQQIDLNDEVAVGEYINFLSQNQIGGFPGL